MGRRERERVGDDPTVRKTLTTPGKVRGDVGCYFQHSAIICD
jgi:hypothetical protein